MAGEPGIKFIGAYHCPHCKAPVEDRTGRSATWLRCPNCGRAFRPSEAAVPVVTPSAASPRDDLYFIDDLPDPVPLTPVGNSWSGVQVRKDRIASRRAIGWRVAFGLALLVSVVLLVFAVYEGDANNVTVFAGASVVLLGLFIRSLGG